MAKQVTDRQAGTDFVASAADTHAERIGKAFEEKFGGFLSKKEKDRLPDIGLAVLLIARAMRAKTGQLVVASDEYDKELSDDAEPRERRDTAKSQLISTMVGIRGTVQSIYGEAVLKKLGIQGDTPTDEGGILTHARKLVTELKSPKLKLPKPQRRGVKVDVSAWVEELSGPIETLDTALKDVTREGREAQAKSEAKATAMQQNDELFIRGARFISAALALVGDDALAGKVRPSARKPGTTLEEEASGEVEEGEEAEVGAEAKEK